MGLPGGDAGDGQDGGDSAPVVVTIEKASPPLTVMLPWLMKAPYPLSRIVKLPPFLAAVMLPWLITVSVPVPE